MPPPCRAGSSPLMILCMTRGPTDPERALAWRPSRPRMGLVRLLFAWVSATVALLVAAGVVAGVHVNGLLGAFVVAAVVAILNAALPPLVASLRLPFTVLTGFLLVLALDAIMLRIAADLVPDQLQVDRFGSALLVSLIAAAVSTMVSMIAGVNDVDEYTLLLARRIARRTGAVSRTDVPGILFLEIDGLGYSVLRRAIRDGTTPTLATWLADGTHSLVEWETDLSSQTGASQAGILLGSNEDIPAFRWVEKESGRVMTCSNPDDCAEIERRARRGGGVPAGRGGGGREGGAPRAGGGRGGGNLLSGGADRAMLTVSRMADERRANPGYRSFLANGSNVTRTLVLYVWEILIELVAAARQRRRDVRPRGHRGGPYPFIRAGVCVFIRDLVTYSLMQDMAQGVPAVYATFASYDEVAHHSGLERPDTLEALRKLDQRFRMIDRARRYAPRPYEIVVLSDHGQTQGATFRQRNDYGLDDLVARSLESANVEGVDAGDEHAVAVGQAMDEATGRSPSGGDEPSTSQGDVVVLGSGNLGLVYLTAEKQRLT